jgi:hypothetical protein
VSRRLEATNTAFTRRKKLETDAGIAEAFEPEDDGYESAKNRARNLLLEILPPIERERFCCTGVIHVTGSRSGNVYEISPGSQTTIRHQGKIIAYTCLQLSLPFPTFDRMVAEYLLIKNDENHYLLTANVFANTRPLGIATLLLIVFDVALILNFALSLYRLR